MILRKLMNKNQRSHIQIRRVKKCFYTGETLTEYGQKKYSKEPYYLTFEHLVSKSKANGAGFSMSGSACVNKVYCTSKINAIVGNAPLKVKFALKKYLSEITILPHPDITIRMRIWCKLAKSFMNRYKIYGIWPWDWDKHHFSKIDEFKYSIEKLVIHRERARKRYINLLTTEEKQLLNL